MASTFRWRALILDDNPKDPAIQGLLESDLRTCFEFLINEDFDHLYSALHGVHPPPHLFLIDMKWVFRAGSMQTGKALPPRPQLRCGRTCACEVRKTPWAAGGDQDCIEDRKRFSHEWLNMVRSCYAADRLDSSEVGLWLTALVSHLYPEARIILYTKNYEEVASKPHMAPWLAFHKPPMRLLSKHSTQPFSLDELLPSLESLQEELLHSQAGLREWTQEKVWLPYQLGLSPEDGTIEVPQIDGELLTLTVKPQVFFPQLNQSNALVHIERLAFGEERNRDITIAMKAAEHLLRRPVQEKACPEEVGTLLAFSQPYSNTALEYFNEEKYTEAWRHLHAALYNGLPYIRGKHTGLEILPDYPTPKDNEFGHPHERFPLDPFRWNSVLAVLVNWAGEYQVQASYDGTAFVLTFLGGETFETLDVFRQKATESLRKHGDDRGLPLLLLFARRQKAVAAEILIKGTWHKLYGEQTGAVAGGSETSGFRMTFKLPHC